jgi:shikimate kinase
MHGKSLIYIIGFMGSGKSTAGKKLASSLSWNFVDLDRKIEEVAGKSIPEIFASDGEDKFRQLETEVLNTLKNNSKTIISTGGGTPCHGNNLDIMLSTGVTINLKMTPGQLAARLLGSTEERPLIKNIPDDRLFGFIETKLAERERWYNRAHIIVEGMNLDINNLHSIIKMGAGA